MAIVSNPSNWQVMHSALGDAYMVLNKSLMDDCKIPRKELERIIGGIEKAMRVQKRNCDRFATGDVVKDADDALHAILDEGVAGYRSIAEYLLSPANEVGVTSK